MRHLEQLPDDAPIKVNLRLEDVARAKKTESGLKGTLEFDLSTDMVQTDTGLFIDGWVHPKRLPTEQRKIVGKMLTEHEVGIVKWFNDAKGLGFIVRNTGEDVFVHYEAIAGDGYRCLRAGSKVRYTLYQTNKGLQAQEVVQLEDEHGMALGA